MTQSDFRTVEKCGIRRRERDGRADQDCYGVLVVLASFDVPWFT